MYDLAHGSATRSRASRTRSAPWSSRTTGRSTTGSSRTCRCRRSRGRSSSPGSTSPTPCSPSAGCCGWSTRATCAAGTTPACPRCPACAGAAIPPRRSATSRQVGVAKSDSVVEVGHAGARVREDLNRTAPRRLAVLDPLKVVIDNYPEGQVEEMDALNNPEDPSAGTPQGALLPGALHRARRLHGGAAAEVLPPGARPRGAPALRLLHHLHRGREGRDRQNRRAALHLRPGHPRRRRARRPQGQGDAPLGVGRPRRARRGPALRPLFTSPHPAPTAATCSTTSTRTR